MAGPLDWMDSDWERLRRSHASKAALARWSAETPLLTAGTLDELLARRLPHVPERDQVLAALASRAPDDDIAASVLLHALRPGLGRLVQTLTKPGSCRPTVARELVAICWERIRTYPIDRRPDRVAANILLDTRKRYLRAQAQGAATAVDPLRLEGLLEVVPDHAEDVVAAAAATPTRDLTVLLQRTLARGLIDPDTARILYRLVAIGEPMAAVAADTGLSAGALRHRRLRALRSLRAAA